MRPAANRKCNSTLCAIGYEAVDYIRSDRGRSGIREARHCPSFAQEKNFVIEHGHGEAYTRLSTGLATIFVGKCRVSLTRSRSGFPSGRVRAGRPPRILPVLPAVCSRNLHAIKKPGSLNRALEFSGVADGTRTHDDRNHNPGLYQLSYSHHCLAGLQVRQARHYTNFRRKWQSRVDRRFRAGFRRWPPRLSPAAPA